MSICHQIFPYKIRRTSFIEKMGNFGFPAGCNNCSSCADVKLTCGKCNDYDNNSNDDDNESVHGDEENLPECSVFIENECSEIFFSNATTNYLGEDVKGDTMTAKLIVMTKHHIEPPIKHQ